MITEHDVRRGEEGLVELTAIVSGLERSVEAATSLPAVCVLVDALDQIRSQLHKAQTLVAWGREELSKAEAGA